MSSYDYLLRGDEVCGHDLRPESVLHHRGDCKSFLDRHDTVVARTLADGVGGARSLASYLVRLIADPRSLRLAWDYLARKGDTAPGPDGLRHGDLADAEVWDCCRAVGAAIRAGTYRRGPDRIVPISKGPGRGERPLVVSNIVDRVVERAVITILRPILDPLFDDASYGYRPGRGPLHALAEAERRVLVEQRRVLLAEDVRDAFLHVPLPRLLQVVCRLLPADDLMALVGTVVSGNRLPGLRQGGPLSPLLLNVYLHHVLDRPWRRDHSELPLVRVADDLLVPCRSTAQAHRARAGLERLLAPAGMPLKGTEATAVSDLGAGATVDWMGFTLEKPARGLAARIGARSWDSLHERLALCHAGRDAPLRAVATIRGWLGQRGPCYAWTDRPAALRRVGEIAAELAFDEVDGPTVLEATWHEAHDRWLGVRQAIRTRSSLAVADDRDHPRAGHELRPPGPAPRAIEGDPRPARCPSAVAGGLPLADPV